MVFIFIVLHFRTESKADFFKLRFIHGKNVLSFRLMVFIFLY